VSIIALKGREESCGLKNYTKSHTYTIKQDFAIYALVVVNMWNDGILWLKICPVQ
jgi:hypothetical protein